MKRERDKKKRRGERKREIKQGELTRKILKQNQEKREKRKTNIGNEIDRNIH